MRSPLPLVAVSALAAISFSCGAAYDAGERDATRPTVDIVDVVDVASGAATAPSADHDPHPDPDAPLGVLGSIADVDVMLDGDDIVLDTSELHLRYTSARGWTASPKPDAEAASMPGAWQTWSLPWTGDTSLVFGVAQDATFAFRAHDGVVAPDFTSLAAKPWLGDGPEVAVATEPKSAHFYALGGSEQGGFGVFEWSAAAGATFTKLPLQTAPYGIYPVAIVVRGVDDVWAFASVTTGADFGPDFPGCPSIVRGSQDAGYVAHFDGARWTELAWPSKQHLDDVHVAADGSFVVSAGWNQDYGTSFFTPLTPQLAVEHWRVDPRSHAWTKSDDARAVRSRALGWSVDADTLVHRGVAVAMPRADRDDVRYVPRRVLAVTEDDAFVLATVMTGDADSGERVWLRTR
jgi:hypothetical protein